MSSLSSRWVRSHELTLKTGELFGRRMSGAHARWRGRVQDAMEVWRGGMSAATESGKASGAELGDYLIDASQRAVLFCDTLHRRGSQFVAHEKAGLPPVLHFEYETVLDAREFARPVNYALLRIVPPAGVVVDARRRPYVIIDPRAGHGPGIGGSKEDSQVGVALRAGHPVYFVVFSPDPEPGQTILDVCEAEKIFVRKVRELHPDSPKPALIGNCQAGWATMMLAASDPEINGPVVINGAPMSYWSGAWQEGENDNLRDVTSAMNEASFFGLYANLYALTNMHATEETVGEADYPRRLPAVQAALAEIETGGYAEAAARIGYLIQHQGAPMSLARLEFRSEMADKHRRLMPRLSPEERRRIRGVQEIIARFEPERALPSLLGDPPERARMLELLDAVVADAEAMGMAPTAEQLRMVERVRGVLA